MALAAYDADEANVHGDCAALRTKIGILKARATGTPQAETVDVIVERANTLCPDAGS